ncbi:hypothetical protein A2210_01980 [Candidatus Woesebacteria bacterium RIFOXYA1_FULL_40_18]|uniref:DUF362 domain-containing protein n=1 Tax=Candidatus Woesebacteria bacterium RIFOXYA1_FULL_40_18 TaxID=1802532 RepID=A0A1F8CIQ2_9BACT|nr:MAG: hypothetical protein A2210_01980 [Candidatus Woesebacteria bacterium RIFOXYA1_FULL_40_18]
MKYTKPKYSHVASVAVKPGNQKELVFEAVEKAMELAQWKKYVKGDNIVLKVNAVWDKVYPCVTTSPMVIEAVIRQVKKHIKPKKLSIADTDTAAFMHTDDSFRILGIERLAKKYHVNLVSLTNTKFKVVPYKGMVLNHLKVSEVLLEADNIITLPIMKTHALSHLTFAIKNQWGCIHDLRHNYHTVLAKALADVNLYFKDKIQFAVGDALVAMEGTGPKTGTPVEVGYIFASHDLVAMDALAATTMGLNIKKIDTIKYPERVGVGTRNYKLLGDKPPTLKFKEPNPKQLVFFTEMFLRHLGPQIESLFFKTPLLYIFRAAAKVYNDTWFNLNSKQRVETIMRTRWGQMWQEYL